VKEAGHEGGLREKPVLRGVSHEVAAFVSFAAWLTLVAAAPGGRARVAAGVYGATLVALFAVSALYHRPTWAPPARLLMRRLDHSVIFLLIAGTYTPFCLLLGAAKGTALLAGIWIAAALGVLQSVFWVRAPRPVAAIFYLALGWAAVPVLPPLRAALGGGAIALLAAGGLAYTLGALIYAARRPDPFPTVFGYHEIFHALVVAAAACHFAVAAQAIKALRG
jgi:hemolysin III